MGLDNRIGDLAEGRWGGHFSGRNSMRKSTEVGTMKLCAQYTPVKLLNLGFTDLKVLLLVSEIP